MSERIGRIKIDGSDFADIYQFDHSTDRTTSSQTGDTVANTTAAKLNHGFVSVEKSIDILTCPTMALMKKTDPAGVDVEIQLVREGGDDGEPEAWATVTLGNAWIKHQSFNSRDNSNRETLHIGWKTFDLDYAGFSEDGSGQTDASNYTAKTTG